MRSVHVYPEETEDPLQVENHFMTLNEEAVWVLPALMLLMILLSFVEIYLWWHQITYWNMQQQTTGPGIIRSFSNNPWREPDQSNSLDDLNNTILTIQEPLPIYCKDFNDFIDPPHYSQ